MREHEVELIVRKGQMLPIADQQPGTEALMSDVLLRQPNSRLRQVDADGPCAAPRKPHQIDAGAAADIEHALPG